MNRKMVIDRKALKYLYELPEKSQQLIEEKCHALADSPFLGHDDDKEAEADINIVSFNRDQKRLSSASIGIFSQIRCFHPCRSFGL